MIELLFLLWTKIFFSFLRDCQKASTLPRNTRGLFVPGKFVGLQRGCAKIHAWSFRTHIPSVSVFFIYFLKSCTRASARFLDRFTRSGTPLFRGGKDRGDENRISLLFRLDTYVCIHIRCPGPATSSRLRPRNILSRARCASLLQARCMLVRLWENCTDLLRGQTQSKLVQFLSSIFEN